MLSLTSLYFVIEDKTIPNILSLKTTFKFYKHDTC